MLSQKLEKAYNEQVNAEFYASYLYLSMSAYFDSQSLTGISSWLRNQAREELAHAMKFFDFIDQRGGRARLMAIEEPPTDFGSPLEAFESSLAHEQKVSGMIHELHKLARAEEDFASEPLLQWFATEQVEEERTAGEIVDQLRMVGDDRTGVLLLDQRLGQRGPTAGSGVE